MNKYELIRAIKKEIEQQTIPENLEYIMNKLNIDACFNILSNEFFVELSSLGTLNINVELLNNTYGVINIPWTNIEGLGDDVLFSVYQNDELLLSDKNTLVNIIDVFNKITNK